MHDAHVSRTVRTPNPHLQCRLQILRLLAVEVAFAFQFVHFVLVLAQSTRLSLHLRQSNSRFLHVSLLVHQHRLLLLDVVESLLELAGQHVQRGVLLLEVLALGVDLRQL